MCRLKVNNCESFSVNIQAEKIAKRPSLDENIQRTTAEFISFEWSHFRISSTGSYVSHLVPQSCYLNGHTVEFN